MKKIAFLIILAVSLNSQAQKLAFGPELGGNLILIEKTDLGRNYHLGWFDGAHVEYSFFDLLSVRSGVYFSHRKKMYGSADTSEFNVFGFSPSDLGIPGVDFNIYSQTTGIVSLFGVEVPLLASLNYKGLSIFGGPYFNFMVGAWSRETYHQEIPFLKAINIDSIDQSGVISGFFPPAETTTFSESSSKTNFRSLDFGFKTGASYTAKNFRFNLYYTFGLPDYRNSNEGEDNNPHRYFSASLAYNFSFSKKGASSFDN